MVLITLNQILKLPSEIKILILNYLIGVTINRLQLRDFGVRSVVDGDAPQGHRVLAGEGRRRDSLRAVPAERKMY